MLYDVYWLQFHKKLKLKTHLSIENDLALTQAKAKCQTGDNPLFEPIMAYVIDVHIRHSTSS